MSHYEEEDGWIDGYIDLWVDDPAKEHISILGEFGTGKTWFVFHYAWTALQRYRDAQKRGVERPINMGDGILLKPKKPFAETTLNDVAGCLKYQGSPKSLEDMNNAIRQGVEELWHGGS